jgi:hypothetical protein
VVDWPFGLTVPLRVALDLPTSLAAAVVTAGALAAAAAGDGRLADTSATASRPQAPNRIAATTRILRMLPPFVSVQYDT